MAVIPFRRRRSDQERVGTMTLMEHLEENLKAARRGPLPADVVAEVTRRISARAAAPE